jgi:hypothetical protein
MRLEDVAVTEPTLHTEQNVVRAIDTSEEHELP